MKTPKEKAEELYGKFFMITPQPYITDEVKDGRFKGLKFNDWDKDWTKRFAKQSALICVDEILSNYEKDDNKNNDCHWLNSGEYKYWEEVKQELEKL